ncbi:DUF3426 domain-containing protein [Amphritea sp.]|uniref:DUF3426 domain-containing protein n=1 Tax=Amphritea sp. TaxID=1872502 RepID=UPI003D13F27E
MSHNIITECPACHTQFQVTQGQLKIANGKVRCGACLEVFNAQVYRCDDLDEPVNGPQDESFEGPPDELTESFEQPFQHAAGLNQQHKDPLFDEIEIPPFSPPVRPAMGFDKRYAEPIAEPTYAQHTKQQLPVQLPGQLSRMTAQRAPEPQSSSVDEAPPQPFFQPPSEPLYQPPTAPQTEPQNQTHPEHQPEPDEPLWQTDTDLTAAQPKEVEQQEQQTQPANHAEPNLDQPVSELLLGIPPTESAETLQQIALPDLQSAPPPEAEPALQAEQQPEQVTELHSATQAAPEPEPEPEPESESESDTTPLSTSPATTPRPIVNTTRSANRPVTPFRAEPVMIRTTREKPRSQTGWVVLSLVAILLLAGQYLWFNRQQLSSDTQLTPIYSLACQHLPCNLDTPIMLEQISTRKLTILQHPDYQGTLSVNLLLENQASIAQPFPAIQLSFSDRLGKLIGQRLFQPADYLDTAPNSTTKMPGRQTVEIHFDILDPGRRALSYEIALKAPTHQNKGL